MSGTLIPLFLDEAYLSHGINKWVLWDMEKAPHGLVVGQSGSGKTYACKQILAHTRIETNCEVYVLDYKADTDFDGLIGCQRLFRYTACRNGLHEFYNRFQQRQSGNDKERYPLLLFFDEWSSYCNSMDKKQSEEDKKILGILVSLGRSFGTHVLISQQRDTEIPHERTRTYATIVYTESAPKDWQEILEAEHIPCHISPLHHKDINKDGTLKKPHFHILLMFDSVKTRKQAEKIFKKIGGVGAEAVNSPRAYARYLCHLDSPDKAQYPIEEVVSYGGADYDMHISTVKDTYTTIGEILDFCMTNNIVCFADLLLLTKENQFNWFRIICDNSMLLCQFLKSKYWDENRQGIKHAVTAKNYKNQAEEPSQEDVTQ